MLRLNLSHSNNSSSLFVDQSSQSSLSLDNGIRDSHLAAQGRQEDHDFHWVNIVGNQNKLGLLVLNQGSDVVQSVLDHQWLGGLFWLSSCGDLGSYSGQSLLLLSLGLWLVLVQKAEGLGSGILVEGLVELVHSGWDLEASLQDGLLSLEADVHWPLDVSAEVALRLDVVADSKVLWLSLESWVLLGSNCRGCLLERCWRNLFGFDSLERELEGGLEGKMGKRRMDGWNGKLGNVYHLVLCRGSECRGGFGRNRGARGGLKGKELYHLTLLIELLLLNPLNILLSLNSFI